MENDHKQMPEKPTIDLNEFFKNATGKQKQEIINSYPLMKNKDTHFMVMYWSIPGLFAFIIIQHSYWKGKTRMHALGKVKEILNWKYLIIQTQPGLD
jgi:hypothetical protein